MNDPIIVIPYDEQWPAQFQETGQRIRAVLGDLALRIDHIGSTAVPKLAAKPIIDIQISVASLEPVAVYKEPLERIGFIYKKQNNRSNKEIFQRTTGRK